MMEASGHIEHYSVSLLNELGNIHHSQITDMDLHF